MQGAEPIRPTRRAVLTGSGLAIAGVAATVGAPPAAASVPAGGVARVAPGSTAVEFRGRITQTGSSGENFSATGILTSLAGAQRSDLFEGATTTVGSALFTVTAAGSLVARVLDQSVHALDIAGTLSVYQRRHGGADFGRPGSFSQGSLVAQFDLTLQDVLTVFATGKGLPTLSGDMRQTQARSLGGALSGNRFGVVGQRLRMLASGIGELVDPVTLNAQLEIAGNWAAE
ncbi:MAG: hypothetical protein ACXV3A_00910 [Kineosporiaceae bacterium]